MLPSSVGPAHPFAPYAVAAAVVLYTLIATEASVRWWRWRRALSVGRVWASASILAVEVWLRTVTFGLRWSAATWIVGLAPIRVSTTVVSVVVLYVLVDFVYYWRHRWLHSFGLGWAVHSTHHSSEEMTILATFRLSWIEAAVRDFFYFPLLLLGFDPLVLLAVVEVNAASQFWCHTDAIGRIPWLDGWLNTPANHRRHHAKSRALAEANYGSTLMLWDRLFGTYARPADRDREAIECGIEGVKESTNPLVLEFGPLVALARSRRPRPS